LRALALQSDQQATAERHRQAQHQRRGGFRAGDHGGLRLTGIVCTPP